MSPIWLSASAVGSSADGAECAIKIGTRFAAALDDARALMMYLETVEIKRIEFFH
jgi:hypothetical protein